ncbi:hypothetical protein CC78DRAFT_530901 [Lojkania enalia]|uniref:Biogenesis of lysosome-related organelles complex 1 subunit 1 n=1 Tax=Lojkania enalia TaxID=147567 RepID=A0A9P4KG07_9PLEO|nr:hypothetical protein CC78DRAFT_530901 [Didymosphaeria enalia]
MSSPNSESERRTAEARAAVTASLTSIGTSINSEITTRAKDLHGNSQAILKQEKELAKQTQGLAKQSKEWEKMGEGARKKLNEIGDIQNWAEMIERDLLVLEETVRLVEGGREEESASGTGTGSWGGR